MLYAVIHDNELLSLHADRDKAKEAALAAATGGKYVDFSYRIDAKDSERWRWEVEYRPARNRAWVRSGFFVQGARLTS